MFTCPADNRVSLVELFVGTRMFTCPADNRVLSRCLVGTRMFTCPDDNRVSVVDVCLN